MLLQFAQDTAVEVWGKGSKGGEGAGASSSSSSSSALATSSSSTEGDEDRYCSTGGSDGAEGFGSWGASSQASEAGSSWSGAQSPGSSLLEGREEGVPAAAWSIDAGDLESDVIWGGQEEQQGGGTEGWAGGELPEGGGEGRDGGGADCMGEGGRGGEGAAGDWGQRGRQGGAAGEGGGGPPSRGPQQQGTQSLLAVLRPPVPVAIVLMVSRPEVAAMHVHMCSTSIPACWLEGWRASCSCSDWVDGGLAPAKLAAKHWMAPPQPHGSSPPVAAGVQGQCAGAQVRVGVCVSC